MIKGFSFQFNSGHLNKAVWALMVLFLLLMGYFRVWENYELQTYDWRFQLRAEQKVRPDIVYIDIWNDALAAFGAWPFDRAYHAELVQALGQAGAKAVLFDVLFVEPKESDEALSSAATSWNNVYLPYALGGLRFHRSRVTADAITEPVSPSLLSSAKATGYVNAIADVDGKYRRMIPCVDLDGKRLWHLSFKAAFNVLGIDEKDVSVHIGKSISIPGFKQIPLDDKGLMLINYAAPWGRAFNHYSYRDVVASSYQKLMGQKPTLDMNVFKDKICIVGLTATASHDTKATPLEPLAPAVGIYAHTLNSLLDGAYLSRATKTINALILLLLLALIYWIDKNLAPKKSFIMFLSVVTIFVLLATLLFVMVGYWIDLFYPVCAIFFMFVLFKLSRILVEMRKRELIEGELKIASQIQQSFLPASVPDVHNLDISVYMKPAKAVGGDLYAFDKNLEDDCFAVMIGDVSGKGTPAALYMAKTVSEHKYARKITKIPSAIMEAVNNSMAAEDTSGLFVTMLQCRFDFQSRSMVFSNAGHLPLLNVTADGQSEYVTSDEGMPIGVMPEIPFSDTTIPMSSEQVMVVYTDGITEARDKNKNEFGADTLSRCVMDNRHKTAHEISEAVLSRIQEFCKDALQHDDMTLIVMKVRNVK